MVRGRWWLLFWNKDCCWWITKDVSLMVTDFSEEDEVEESKMLWESQIADLKQVLGSS